MARRKTVENDVLVSLIDQFFEENRIAGKVNLTKVAEYVRAHGYPDYAVESLRRNEVARTHINTILNVSELLSEQVITYKTLDVEEFLTTHPTRTSMRSALAALDGYYHAISDQAAKTGKKYNLLLRDIQVLRNEKDAAEKNLDILSEEVRCLKEQNKKLAEIIKNYVYPDIANDLLAKEGVIPGMEARLDQAKLDNQIIRGDTEIQTAPSTRSGSSVIQGIFDNLEDDE